MSKHNLINDSRVYLAQIHGLYTNMHQTCTKHAQAIQFNQNAYIQVYKTCNDHVSDRVVC